jgi:hypothetical protein
VIISAQLSLQGKAFSHAAFCYSNRERSGVAAHNMQLRVAVMPAWAKKYFGESDIDPADWDVR